MENTFNKDIRMTGENFSFKLALESVEDMQKRHKETMEKVRSSNADLPKDIEDVMKNLHSMDRLLHDTLENEKMYNNTPKNDYIKSSDYNMEM